MYSRIYAILAAVLVSAPVAAAIVATPGAPQKEITVEEVVTQPLSDVNAKKKEIPPLLTKVVENPYSLEGIRKCPSIIAAVNELNSVLGPDFDAPDPQTRGAKLNNSAMRIGGGFLTSFMPFRWVIREFSGANKADDNYRNAIYAGVVRRGFLKGYGKSRGCKAPGSPTPLLPTSPETDAALPEKS